MFSSDKPLTAAVALAAMVGAMLVVGFKPQHYVTLAKTKLGVLGLLVLFGTVIIAFAQILLTP